MPTLAFLIAISSLGAAELSGEWEIQSMGADRKVTVQQKGRKIVIHRVMWPEFEGERYRLEHLYRGTVNGEDIQGKLLVKEDELPDWEVLRSFTGSTRSGKLVIDGMPMKRLSGHGAAPPDPKGSGKRAAPPPAMSKAGPEQGSDEGTTVAMNPPPPPAPPEGAPAPEVSPAAPAPAPAASAAPEATASAPADDSGGLFANIMGSPGMQDLFMVSSHVTIPNPVADLTDEGDALFKKRRYAEALSKFEEAAKISTTSQPELVHRMGRCYLKLKKYTQASQLLRKALKLDPHNERLRNDYRLAKKHAA